MSKPESKPRKPRKAAAKKAPAKKPVPRKRPTNPPAGLRGHRPAKRAPKTPEGTVPKSEWIPSKTNPSPVGRALHFAVTAFKGDKGALAEYLGIHRPNLSRAITQSRVAESTPKGSIAPEVTWPLTHVLKLAKVSGVAPHELAPESYEVHMKPRRLKFVDGKPQAE